jgi:signal transduction histidine kinase
MLFAVALALLVAQLISAALLVRSQELRREQGVINASAFRLAYEPAGGDATARRREGDNEIMRRGRGSWLQHSDTYPLAPDDMRDSEREKVLRTALGDLGVLPANLHVTVRLVGEDPLARLWLRIRPGLPDRRNAANTTRRILVEDTRRLFDDDTRLVVAAMQRETNGEWIVSRVPIPSPDPRALGGIIGQTLILYFVLVGGLALLLRRITRPLAALTTRVEHFANTRETHDQLEPAGPQDMRRLIAAHNAMEARIAALLDEKDVMLGAIGHDLKTPLAALRVRIESVEDDTERAKMAGTIEDITNTLDDILSFARVGRPSDRPESTDLAALAASVVEEFEDMGEDVTLGEASRIALAVRATWLRRALRNLIANALRYGGGRARVSLVRDSDMLAIRVEDDGQGIPEDDLLAMLEPFRRGDPSRNKETGGSGLGLALARAIAEQHGGTLVLSNRIGADGAQAGLTAEIRLPVAS